MCTLKRKKENSREKKLVIFHHMINKQAGPAAAGPELRSLEIHPHCSGALSVGCVSFSCPHVGYSLLVCASVLHSHCFCLEVFQKSIFSCGMRQRMSALKKTKPNVS